MRGKGFTQRDLVRVSKVPESRLSEYLNRKRPMTVQAMRTISAALDLPVAVPMQEYAADSA